ncbi:HepT-like ribonuclease domain-containing protein [Methanospirillum hungatei]|uniref:HepT-like ribonuclease domain-containing protein n=1 Tax=Methanospirillum hungatei TaxID=2203 RepID=UPI000A05123A
MRAEDYADTFLVIAENGVLKRDEAHHLGEMARFRNRLVHQYWRIDIADYAKKILDLLKP